MKKYILAHDLGTSGNKATLFDVEGNLIASLLYEYPTYYPKEGWVEQNPEEWWRAICLSTKELLSQVKINKSEVAVISFSAQMMGCLLIDEKGIPLRNMIIWADTRANEQANEMELALGMDKIYQITGHRISASYSAAKLLWIRKNEPDVYKKAYKMLHAKDYIIYRLTGKIVSDYSDASGTNLFDLRKKEWSTEILDTLEIPLSLLPELHASSDVAGTILKKVAEEIGLQEGTPVVIGGGDGSCACVGAGAIREGEAYNVLGSSSWIAAVSKEPIYDLKLRTFNWVHLDQTLYTPCGTMQAAGYSYQWYKNVLCKKEIEDAKMQGISPYEIIDKGANQSKPGANKLLYLPYLLGERSPRWNHNARGAFVGMSITTTKEDMSRAVLEGIGYNLKTILNVLEQKICIEKLTIIGGGAKGELWLQILADIWQKELVLPMYPEEATSMGAAVCGGVGIGVYNTFEAVELFNHKKKSIIPQEKNKIVYKEFYEIFEECYNGLVSSYDKLAKVKML